MTWHTTTRLAENLSRISEPFGAIEPRVGVTTANMYLVIGQERAALIDSGMGIGDARAEILRSPLCLAQSSTLITIGTTSVRTVSLLRVQSTRVKLTCWRRSKT